MKCPNCRTEIKYTGESVTYIGYISPKGHDHNDNCVVRRYKCFNCRQEWSESKRNRCSTPGCGWVGKKTCGCHEGEKVDKWTD